MIFGVFILAAVSSASVEAQRFTEPTVGEKVINKSVEMCRDIMTANGFNETKLRGRGWYGQEMVDRKGRAVDGYTTMYMLKNEFIMMNLSVKGDTLECSLIARVSHSGESDRVIKRFPVELRARGGGSYTAEADGKDYLFSTRKDDNSYVINVTVRGKMEQDAQ